MMKKASCLSLLLAALAMATLTGCDTADYDHRAASVSPAFPPAPATQDNAPSDLNNNSQQNPTGIVRKP